MSLNAFVDVAIGLAVVYLGASLLVTVINEYVAQVARLRGRHLAADLKRLIDVPALQNALKMNPALAVFLEPEGTSAKSLGSYVDPGVVARQIVGALRTGVAAGSALAEVSGALEQLPDESNLKRQLLSLVRTTTGDVEALVANVGAWVDRSLTMLGERYKRHLQTISFFVGLAVAVVLNLDSLAIVSRLYVDKQAREATAAIGVDLADAERRKTLDECLALPSVERRKRSDCALLDGLVDAIQGRDATLGHLPIGWPRIAEPGRPEAIGWFLSLVGWIATALAVSLGAPFWFDLLNRLVNVRHGMRPPDAPKPASGTPAGATSTP